mgnify:CR=1 FL=1
MFIHSLTQTQPPQSSIASLEPLDDRRDPAHEELDLVAHALVVALDLLGAVVDRHALLVDRELDRLLVVVDLRLEELRRNELARLLERPEPRLGLARLLGRLAVVRVRSLVRGLLGARGVGLGCGRSSSLLQRRVEPLQQHLETRADLGRVTLNVLHRTAPQHHQYQLLLLCYPHKRTLVIGLIVTGQSSTTNETSFLG